MSTTITPTGTWNVDPAHSRVGFSIGHLGISTVHGQFNEFEGALEIGEDIASAQARGTVKVASIDTGEKDRDGHLLNSDFFDAENHPEITIETTAIEPSGDNAVKVTGDLTIMGTTKSVELKGHVGGMKTDPMGSERVGLQVCGEVSRDAFGMKFNIPLDSGGLALSDKVKLTVDISAIRAQ